MSSATRGRLYTKPSGEGGADQIYDGASKSAFDDALTGKHGGAAWQVKVERFKVEPMAPDVEVRNHGIGDSAQYGKPTATWAQNKPRFEEAKLSTPAEYEVARSEFGKAAKPTMIVPEKNRGRDSWISSASGEQANSPAPNLVSGGGAFDDQLKKTAPSHYSQAGGDRFKNLYSVSSNGEPTSTIVSDFDKAARNTKPSPNAVAGGDRFKQAYDIPSYGDPGASASTAELERQHRDQKLARQRAQAEAERDRVMY